MMKKNIKRKDKVEYFCDECGTEVESKSECLKCGKDICDHCGCTVRIEMRGELNEWNWCEPSPLGSTMAQYDQSPSRECDFCYETYKQICCRKCYDRLSPKIKEVIKRLKNIFKKDRRLNKVKQKK